MIVSGNIISKLVTVTGIMLLALVVSCTKVDFDEGSGGKRIVPVEFALTWSSDVTSSSKPAYVTVFMNRIQDTTKHYVFKFENGALVEKFGVTPFSDEVFEEEEVPENPNAPKVHNGHYSIAAIAATDYSDFLFEELDLYADSLAYRMKDMYVTIPQLLKEEQLTQNYIDFNPMYPYLKNVRPFWYVRPSNNTFAFISSKEGTENTIRLELMPLTKKIIFSVKTKVETGVTIQRCLASISGIPQQVQLMTGVVSERNTGKIAFDMAKTAAGRYEGYINSFGIIPASNPELLVGPAVLTVIFHVSVEDNGITSNRIYYANYPVTDQIYEQEIMRRDNQTSGLILNSAKSEYRIDVDMTHKEITKEMVLSGNAEGYEEWLGGTEGSDDKNDNPGLNPEI